MHFGKPISNKIATNKVLRCLSREWQPKEPVIKEANNLTKLDITTLFRKLEEHRQELISLDKYEKKSKKEKNKDKDSEKKSVALVASSSKSSDGDSSSDEDSDDEEMRLFVRRYNKFIRKNGIKHFDKNLMKF